MGWIYPPVVKYALWAPIWCGVLGIILFSTLGIQSLGAQATIYRWTDEHGVVHYSNSTMSHEQSGQAQTFIMPERPAPANTQIAASTSHGSSKIPLVLLNNDPSQKFVRAVLQGDYTSKEVLMLVDTGAQRTLIDDKLARELDIEHVQDAMLSGITGSAKGWIGRLDSLKIGQDEVEDLHVIVAPVSGRLLLGMDVLEKLSLAVSPRSLDRVQ